MSTRATVHFQRNGITKAIVYRHCDGYPDGLGDDLEQFHRQQTFMPKGDPRLDDPTAVAARFVQWHAGRGDVAIVLQDPPDIEYRYLVRCDGPGTWQVTAEDRKTELLRNILAAVSPEDMKAMRAIWKDITEDEERDDWTEECSTDEPPIAKVVRGSDGLLEITTEK